MISHKAVIVSALVLSITATGLAVAQEREKAPGAPAPAAAPGAPASPTAPAAPAGNGAGVNNAEYRIGTDDILDIAVWNNTTVSRTVQVRPDGKITLPLLNEIQAAGLTPNQLRGVIAQKLVEYMPNPELSVIVREVRSNKVSVLGEVRKAGRYEFTTRATVLDALALAGGFNDWARRSRVVIMRNEGGTVKRIPFDYNKVVAQEAENVVLQPGDIVVVP